MDYVAEALVTKSDKFHGEKVNSTHLLAVLDGFIAQAKMLDKMKKALFYGRDLPIAVSTADSVTVLSHKFAPEERFNDLLHAILGQATEAGEMAEALLAAIRLGKFDKTNLAEECGDSLWYNALLLHTIDSTFETEMARNILKLRARFPEKFTEYDANNRDLGKERRILEKHIDEKPKAK